MTVILAVETSGVRGGVALSVDGRLRQVIRFDRDSPASMQLIPAIDTILARDNRSLNSVDEFAVSIGPGSFTGLRVGLTAVKTLAYFCRKPVKKIPTLMALAVAAGPSDKPIVAMLDARKGEVYGAIFRVGDSIERLTPDRVVSVETLLAYTPLQPLHLTGDALRVYRDRIFAIQQPYTEAPEAVWDPSPEAVAWLAETTMDSAMTDMELFQLAPVYIRRSEAEINWETKHLSKRHSMN
ncbi:tRNA (adenosine(37)-N6)-threonylcarbamoyltransferase complex dimerization subunit type 1 TsaB [bacterium]|nr:tRNA (adenosine(37)-N6)-threonylcarbamoyltransferase complex dimerization subunit type 1 TsaB [candidate division CSSED10-310 bacterium]